MESWEPLTFEALPLVLVLLLAAALPAGVALYAYGRRSTRGTLVLALLLLAMGEWALAYAVELTVADPAAKQFWEKVKLVGVLALPTLWLALALYHTGRGGWLNRRHLALLAFPPVLMLAIIWTDIAWRDSRFDASGPPEVGFWVIVAYSYALLLLGAALLVSNLFGSQRLYRKQSAILLSAAVVPWVANGLNVVGVAPIARVDPTPLAFPLSAAALAWGIWRYRLLDIVPVDRTYLIEGMTEGVIVLDSRNRILDLNPAAEKIIGTESPEAIGQNISSLVSNRTGWLIRGRREGDPLESHRGERKQYAEVSVGEGRERRTYDLVLAPLDDEGDRGANRLLLLRDITERKRAEGNLDRLAHYDSLTNLPNRRLLHDRVNQALAQARRRETKVAFLFLDLDRFKQINDTLGHDVGDMLLKAVAARLSGCVRETDTVSRLAGDEFVVLLTDLQEAGDATMVAQRIVDTLSDPFELKDHEVRVTTSIGISLYPLDGRDGTRLLENADAAMYRAKALGKDRFEFYKDEHSVTAGERLEDRFELALESGEFLVYYQPIVAMESGRVFGVEALVRWNHPERGLLVPAEFIRAAEESGLIVPIGLAVLKESCAQATRWHERQEAGPPLTVSVNLSAKQLEHPDLTRDVERILRETNLAGESLLLEVSESTIMKDAWAAAAVLGRLKDLGVRFAIDDFGTGYSSLPHLNRLPVDFLKIDRSLVDGLEEDGDKKIAATAIVSLAHALDMAVIGEGVETSRQLAHLKGIGCDLVQGHYLGEALPPDEVARTISFIDHYQ